MSKSKIIFLRVIPIVLILMLVISTNVFAFGSFEINKVENIQTGTDSIDSADAAVGKVWNTVVLILQVLAVAAVVFAGVRYMFASADGKADIKKQSIGLIVGAILVFGATFIIQFVVNVTKEVTGTTKNASGAKYTGTTYESPEGKYSDYDKDGYNDWDDIIGPDGIPDIYQQDTNNNGTVDYQDLWDPEHSESK